MEISIALSQVLRAQESVELLLAEEVHGKHSSRISEALEALQLAEMCIYEVLKERSEGLGQCMTNMSYAPKSREELLPH
jgi:FtsZ-binding cell division protein ZapB